MLIVVTFVYSRQDIVRIVLFAIYSTSYIRYWGNMNKHDKLQYQKPLELKTNFSETN